MGVKRKSLKEWLRDLTVHLVLAEDAIEELQNREVDYIVEQGTDGIWTYRKWNSGIAECWGTWNGTLSNYTTALGGYGYYTDLYFPSGLFISIPIATDSAYIGAGFALTGTRTASLSKDYYRCFIVSSASGSQTVVIYSHVIGNWK